jgi:recombination DNA repair RAD52 pathway protein
VGGVAVGGAVGGVGGGAVGDGAAENEVDVEVEVEVEGPVDQTVDAVTASVLATAMDAISAQDDNEKEEALACIEAKKDAAVKAYEAAVNAYEAAMEACESERAAYLDGLEEKKRKRTDEYLTNIVQFVRAYATDGQRKQARA